MGSLRLGARWPVFFVVIVAGVISGTRAAHSDSFTAAEKVPVSSPAYRSSSQPPVSYYEYMTADPASAPAPAPEADLAMTPTHGPAVLDSPTHSGSGSKAVEWTFWLLLRHFGR